MSRCVLRERRLARIQPAEEVRLRHARGPFGRVWGVWGSLSFEENDSSTSRSLGQAPRRSLRSRPQWACRPRFCTAEAGPAFQGTIKSVSAFSVLLAEGNRHDPCLSVAPPVEEVKVGTKMLESARLQGKLEITRARRAQVDVDARRGRHRGPEGPDGP